MKGADARPGLRPQYHFRKTAAGFDIWSVARLVELTNGFDVFQVAPGNFAELSENHWYQFAEDVPTPLSLIEHIRLIQACDLSYPIILDAQGRIMDGMHRVCKAVLQGEQAISAVQFEVDPPPDFKNCHPSELPYGT